MRYFVLFVVCSVFMSFASVSGASAVSDVVSSHKAKTNGTMRKAKVNGNFRKAKVNGSFRSPKVNIRK